MVVPARMYMVISNVALTRKILVSTAIPPAETTCPQSKLGVGGAQILGVR